MPTLVKLTAWQFQRWHGDTSGVFGDCAKEMSELLHSDGRFIWIMADPVTAEKSFWIMADWLTADKLFCSFAVSFTAANSFWINADLVAAEKLFRTIANPVTAEQLFCKLADALQYHFQKQKTKRNNYCTSCKAYLRTTHDIILVIYMSKCSKHQR